jgi:SAM-dependent methyltransferase
LDIGCGAGRHSLYLQEQGHSVIGLDISQRVLDVAVKRGLKQVIHGSIFNLKAIHEKVGFDTLLVMGNNLPLSGTPDKMVTILEDMASITNEEGKVLLTFVAPVPTTNQYHLNYHQQNRDQDRPIGILRFRLRYKNLIGNWIDFYLPTQDEFQALVEETIWTISHHDTHRNFHFVELMKLS